MEKKFFAFEYLVWRLLEWRSNYFKTDFKQTKISKTHILKLLFLVSAIHEKDGKDLLDIFNKFYAMQYGPVEGDIFNYIENKKFLSLGVDKDSLFYATSLEGVEPYVEKEHIKKRIDDAINLLTQKDSSIIKLRSTQLVEITHKWWCWQTAYSNALLIDKRSYLMSKKSIRESNQVFSSTSCQNLY